MNTLALRAARLEFKTTNDTKTLLSEAAALDGMDLTSFVLGPAIEKARRVIQEHSNITLARRGQLALAQLLSSPKAPNAAIQDLMDLPDLSRKA
jgi:uncharacterized protein (DUF1778 family)